MPQNNNQNNQNGPGNNNRQTLWTIMLCLLISVSMFAFFGNSLGNSRSREITYDRFVEMVHDGEVEKVLLEDNQLTVTPKDQPLDGMDLTYSVILVGDENGLNELLEETDIEYSKKAPNVGAEIASAIDLIAEKLSSNFYKGSNKKVKTFLKLLYQNANFSKDYIKIFQN